MQANQFWQMRVSPRDKKMIAYVAKHFRTKQSKIGKALFRELYRQIKSNERNPNQLSTVG